MATVSSVLRESTTTISSAQATDASASAMSAASFLVMTVTESFGTAGVYSGIGNSGLGIGDSGLANWGMGIRDSDLGSGFSPTRESRIPKPDSRVPSSTELTGDGDLAGVAARRRELYRFEVDQRLVVVRNGLDFRGPCLCEIALCLEDEEAGRHARGLFLFLCLELLLLQLARCAR